MPPLERVHPTPSAAAHGASPEAAPGASLDQDRNPVPGLEQDLQQRDQAQTPPLVQTTERFARLDVELTRLYNDISVLCNVICGENISICNS